MHNGSPVKIVFSLGEAPLARDSKKDLKLMKIDSH